MNIQYWGATATTDFTTYSGLSQFLSRARISLYEGYNYGSSTEYVNKGDFYVEQMLYGGFADEKLSLSAYSKTKEVGLVSNLYKKVYKSAQVVTDTFSDDSWNNAYSVDASDTASYGATETFGYLGQTEDFYKRLNIVFNTESQATGKFSLLTSGLQPISNMTALCRSHGASRTLFASLGSTYAFWLSFRSPNAIEGYRAVYKRPENTISLELFNQEGVTVLSSVSGISIDSGSYQKRWDLSVICEEENIRVLGSTNLSDFTEYINVNNSTYSEGYVGFGISAFIGVSQVSYSVEKLSIWENSYLYSQEDIIKSAYSMADIGTTFANLFNYPTYLYTTLGSCWVFNNHSYTRTGTSAYVAYDAIALFNTDTYSVSNISNQSFVFDCKIRGSSGSAGGLGVGRVALQGTTDLSLVGDLFYFGSTLDHKVVYNNGATSHYYGYANAKIMLEADTWYDFRFINKNGNFVTYINEKQSSAIFPNKSLQSETFFTSELVLFQDSVQGGSVTFSEPRVSVASRLVDNIVLDVNETIESLISRVSSGDLSLINTLGIVEIFYNGASRFIWNLNGSTNLVSEKQTIRNGTPTKVFGSLGLTFGIGIGSTNSRQVRSLDTGKIVFDNSGINFTVDDLYLATTRKGSDFFSEKETVSLVSQIIPQLQQGDVFMSSDTLPYDNPESFQKSKRRLRVKSFNRKINSNGGAEDDITLILI